MALCANCGHEVAPSSVECDECGCPRAPEHVTPAVASRTEPLAIASVVFGIAGLVILPFVGSVLAIVLGSLARARMRHDPSRGGAQYARNGIRLGWIGTILIAVVFAAILIGLIVTARP